MSDEQGRDNEEADMKSGGMLGKIIQNCHQPWTMIKEICSTNNF